MNHIEEKLSSLREKGNLRVLSDIDGITASAVTENREFINLSSNDYLSLGNDPRLQREFFESASRSSLRLAASSSRLLTGNTTEYIELEKKLRQLYNAPAALVVGSGYHANSGILPALCTDKTLILADKLIHASLVDGVRLSKGKCIRYRHNDYHQLERLLKENHALYETVIIVTESVFSMDGDRADLLRLTEMKRNYGNVLLYIDEAHAVGIYGPNGLGCCEEAGCIAEVDLLVGTFGKALGSVGAFVICSETLYDFLVNTMRTLIFTTALPPLNLAWTLFVLNNLGRFEERRKNLKHLSSLMHRFISESDQPEISDSHIIPLIVGDSQKALELSALLREEGFHIMPVRPPAVPEGTSRLRISLCADLTESTILKLIDHLRYMLEDEA